MKQNELNSPDGANRGRKRVGRGYGSGHVKTSGRGQKGQKSRSGGNIRVGFEGGQIPLIRRMPYKRGFTNILKTEYHLVNVSDIARLNTDQELTPEAFIQAGIISPKKGTTSQLRVKLLGDGEVTKAVKVRVHKVSAAARAKVEAAGGTIEVIE